jgi:hypothetical protein
LTGTLVAAYFTVRSKAVSTEGCAAVVAMAVLEETECGQVPVDEQPVVPLDLPRQPAATAQVPPKASEATKALEPDPVRSPERPARESFGTSIEFVSNPTDAARLARQENKLLFVLHISGNFEDDQFT